VNTAPPLQYNICRLCLLPMAHLVGYAARLAEF
jgi:hypothetical protein